MSSAGKIPVRPIGSQGLKSSAQGLGCMSMVGAYFDKRAPSNDEESIAVIHRFRELTEGDSHVFLDTADVYGPELSEKLVGKAIAGSSHNYTIATKFGNTYAGLAVPNGNHAANGHANGTHPGVEGSAEYVKQAVLKSLERLGVDSIDLYYQHRVDRTRPIEETWGALKELVQEGKVKYLGISEASAKEIRKAHAVHPVTAVQIEWSLWSRDVEKDIIPTCRELGIGIVAFSPLGRGLFTGTINDLTNLSEKDMRIVRQPRFQGDNFQRNLLLVEEVKKLAAKKGVTPGQLALAWVHHQGEDVFPIPGTKRLKYLEENVAAFHVKLTKQELNEIQAIFEGKVSGARYTDEGMKKAFYGGE